MEAKPLSLFKEFARSEKNAGLLLLVCAALSLFTANSPLGESYTHFWHKNPGSIFGLELSLEQWINDGLMTLFFLMVGLEIERELYSGELNKIRKAALPIIGAIGGMLVPALIYIIFNYNSSTLNGFGIPMGTDIAFALGILSLAGSRVPLALKILLTAIAIIDDLGSILIIAFFYGDGIQYPYLIASLSVLLFLFILNRMKVISLFPYILLGIPMWYLMMRSGIHPTISGVLLAFVIPFNEGIGKSPSYRIQRNLHVPVAMFILPLFTLANTAIPIIPEFLSGLNDKHAIGIGLGLMVGKPLGILSASFVCIKLGLVKLPGGVKWFDLLAMACIAGIGFTMSIFITQLAFSDEVLIQSSKLMILLASALAACLGLILFGVKKISS